jgi:hypothetical protein
MSTAERARPKRPRERISCFVLPDNRRALHMLAVDDVTAQLALRILASPSTELAVSRCGNGVEGFIKTAAV